MHRCRPATLTESALLAAWAQAMAWETEQKRLDPATVEAGVRGILESPTRGAYFIAERDGQPVGTLMLTYEWSDWRQGVFRALYQHVWELARATPGVCGLRLYVERHNEGAQRTYESLDMVDAGYRMYEAAIPRG